MASHRAEPASRRENGSGSTDEPTLRDRRALREVKPRRTGRRGGRGLLAAAGVAAAVAVVAAGVSLSGALDSPAEAHVSSSASSDALQPLSPQRIGSHGGSSGTTEQQGRSASGAKGAANSAGGSAQVAEPNDRAGRSISRKVLPGCSGKLPSGSAENGRLPASWLCHIGVGNFELRADAAVAFAVMNAAYKSDTGKSLCLTDAYRSIGVQQSAKANKPGLAAVPGTSQHGWGIAIDFGCAGQQSGQGRQWDWLIKHSKQYGWENPQWAKSSKFEPWHFEWAPGRGKK